MRLIESVLSLTALIASLLFPNAGARWFVAFEAAFSKFSRKRSLAIVSVGVAALLVRAALLPVLPKPQPVIGDEFGYLLQADTFAHGRLTNPTHPMWLHFETFNILQKPTYQCFMQPAQGFALAAGEVIAGHPFWGVWFTLGVMCAVICWMLQAWLSPEWALLGGIFAILRFGTFSYWADGYMGGAIAATGGALVLGALPRIRVEPRLRDSIAMGMGGALLAFSRPYEGLVFCLPIAIALAAWMVRRNPRSDSIWRSVFFPLAVFLVGTAAALGFYFFRVTGSPFEMPYQVHQQTYAVAPYFIWQHLRPEPAYHQAAIRDAYANLYPRIYQFARSPIGVLSKIYWVWNFFVGPVLTLPIVVAIGLLPYGFSWTQISRSTRLLLQILGISLAGLMVETYFGAHYAAPMTSLLLALVLIAMREARQWQFRGKPSGVFLTRVIPLICLLMIVVRGFAGPLSISLPQSPEPAWFEARSSGFGREKIASALNRLPGKQLVIVYYGPNHSFINEWVYNDADIDNSKIVWAHAMAAQSDNELVAYFHDRRAWLLDADKDPPQLSPRREQGKAGGE